MPALSWPASRSRAPLTHNNNTLPRAGKHTDPGPGVRPAGSWLNPRYCLLRLLLPSTPAFLSRPRATSRALPASLRRVCSSAQGCVFSLRLASRITFIRVAEALTPRREPYY